METRHNAYVFFSSIRDICAEVSFRVRFQRGIGGDPSYIHEEIITLAIRNVAAGILFLGRV